MTLTERLSKHAHDLDADGHHPYSALPSGSNALVLGFLMDGGGSAISTGIKGSVLVPFDCEVESVTLLANVSGSCVVDIWIDAYGVYPPSVGDSITAASKPTLSSAMKYQDAVLSGWDTSISSGDVLVFNVDSLSTITQLTCALGLRKV